MTTVIDPNGSPIPVFNKSGLAIISMDGGGTSQNPANAVEIEVVSEHTIVRLNNTSIAHAVKVSAGLDVGTLIEIFVLNTTSSYVTLQGSEVFLDGGNNHSIGGRSYYKLRKTGSLEWTVIPLNLP